MFLANHQLLVDLQQGFRAGHSHHYENQLITTVDEHVCNIRQNSQSDIAVLDFGKAFDFDTLLHKRLIDKITSYSIDNNSIQWIKEWLHIRSQTVVGLLDGEKSQPCVNSYC